VNHELLRASSPEAAAHEAARVMVELARTARAATGHVKVAVSGGRTPALLFRDVVASGDDIGDWTVWQVDERVAPDGDPARNLGNVLETFGLAGAHIEAMPVNEPDLDVAAVRYAEHLPAFFDVVHLGLGSDGHTASLVPGDDALHHDGLVAPTGLYQGRRRLTLTYAGLARAKVLLWLVTGEDKVDALQQLLAGDPGIPASQVHAPRSVIVADAAALGGAA
jgi:6-phosphogluconolactonase